MTASLSIDQIAFQLILHSGNARSDIMEAMFLARQGKFEEAKQKVEAAKQELNEAHRTQTTLIQAEAKGIKNEVSILMVHAQDHLMTSITVKELAEEIIFLHEKMAEDK
ncbi:PTS lactose/cellobiose transporter subunit IIA [Bacillus massiliigorillae]|uniref:PTS lactose/cellobiose transporter subunit IIA n=1 Tax=Bacillus massiliigorillae TaxID=1243664 RepID=UPI00039CAE16|nr:PTS lactose/cellobiose transporter subunit IIA [Bacillus massiliigorillae]